MVYNKEALGRGDYWLALGIGAYLTIEHLPLFLFIACLLGIMAYWISRKPVLPFAPFLCLSLIITSAIKPIKCNILATLKNIMFKKWM